MEVFWIFKGKPISKLIYRLINIFSRERKAGFAAKAEIASNKETLNQGKLGSLLTESMVSDTVNSMVISINKLKMASGNLKEIVDIITRISSEINLLALDAAIEASRKDWQVKGFSAPADEMRRLSDESSKSVGDLKQQIKDVRSVIRLIMERFNSAMAEDENPGLNHAGKGTKEIVWRLKQAADSLRASADKVYVGCRSSREFDGFVSKLANACSETASQDENFILLLKIQAAVSGGLDEVFMLLHDTAADLFRISQCF
ncbi:MAG TPA: methyl-accepting chemotaxis protein [Ruminiclostridium sp.]|nr:methyl-accepting chemotaxis protein [Ruminiclostridium sp.]